MTEQGDGRNADVIPLRKGLPGAEVEPYHSDVSYEIELDDTQAPGAPVPVDPPGGGVLVPAEPEFAPILPDHLKSLKEFRRALALAGRRGWHKTRYHGVRSPRYAAVALWYALIGLLRLAGLQISWWWVAELEQVRSAAAAKKDGDAYLKVHQAQSNSRKNRGAVLLAEVVALAAAVVLLVKTGHWWVLAAAGAVAVPVLAKLGKPADRQIVTRAVVSNRFRVLNADVVLRAYYKAGLGDPKKDGEEVTFGSRMARDGAGTGVVVDLPFGKGLDDVMAARNRLASGLDVTESQVFISRDATSYRRHALWVADTDPLAQPVGRTPLLACRQTDIWKPMRLGLDERGQDVDLLLMWIALLVGALPRQGKSFTARHVGLYAALDPYVRMSVFDAAGKPDWRKFALVADSCAFGLTPTREGLPPEILLATLERIKDDVQDRYNRLSAMPTTICPEGKLTRRIARDPDFGMPVELLLLDEFQEYFDLGDISKEIAALLVFLTKVAPGAGFILVDSTQKPSGIGTGRVAQLFNAARDNHGVRFSLRTSSYSVSEAVLGQGAYGEGLDSSTLLPGYKGVGILRGASDRSPTVRTYLADGNDAEKILTAARKLRERAGTLSGMAAGEEAATHDRDVLADVLSVFDGEPGLHWNVVEQRLARAYPDRWADVTAEAISAQCRDLKVPSVDVRYPTGRDGKVVKGCRKSDLEAVKQGAPW